MQVQQIFFSFITYFHHVVYIFLPVSVERKLKISTEFFSLALVDFSNFRAFLLFSFFLFFLCLPLALEIVLLRLPNNCENERTPPGVLTSYRFSIHISSPHSCLHIFSFWKQLILLLEFFRIFRHFLFSKSRHVLCFWELEFSISINSSSNVVHIK